MKCCCNQYTFGIILGANGVVGSIIFLILELATCEAGVEVESKLAIEVSLIITTSISALFVLGIVKKWHNLMIPWLTLLAYVLLELLSLTAYQPINSFHNPYGILSLILVLFVGVTAIAVFGFSCYLYNEVRKENCARLSGAPTNKIVLFTNTLDNLNENLDNKNSVKIS